MAKLEERMCRAAIQSLISSLESLHAIHCIENAIPDALLAKIYQLNLSDQTALIQRARYFVDISLNTDALARQLEELEAAKDREALENLFLEKGAPRGLMRDLFGMHTRQFSRRRKTLKLKGSGSGRPPCCDENSEHLLWRVWQANKHLPEHELYLLLANETGLEIRAICQALAKYLDT